MGHQGDILSLLVLWNLKRDLSSMLTFYDLKIIITGDFR